MEKRKIKYLFLVLVFFISNCKNESSEICKIERGVQKKEKLSPKTKLIYQTLKEGTITFKNNEGLERRFRLNKYEGVVHSEIKIENAKDECGYLYYTSSDRFSLNYSNIMELQNIYVDFYAGRYEIMNSDFDSVMALHDYISFGGGNISIAARFVTERKLGLIGGEEDIIDDYLTTDTMINQIYYDSIYILPNKSELNNIIYSIQYGVVQFEDNEFVWNICL